MPVFSQPNSKATLTTLAAAPSPSGVIVYQWDSQAGTLNGTFVLALYGGALAAEKGTKVSGAPCELAGEYAITTYTPQGDVFANGSLIVAALGSDGAYEVTFILVPVDLAALGFVDGTVLNYKAIGLLPAGTTQLVVAWDNDVYTRSWPGFEEWGMRVVAAS